MAIDISNIKFDVSAILDDLNKILALDSEAEVRKRLFNLSLSLENFYNKFEESYKNLTQYITLSNRSKQLRAMHKLYTGTSTNASNFADQTDALKQKLAYENMLNILLEGYRLIHGIRDILTENPIKYQIVYSYRESGEQKDYSYSMTFEELLKYTTPSLLGRASHAENALVTLQLQLKNEIKQLDINREDLKKDILYQNVIKHTGGSHTLPAPNANTTIKMKKSRLIEVFYHLRSVEYEGTAPRDLIHHFYDESLINLSNIKGGDVLDVQLKSSKTFDLTRVTTVRNTLKSLIDLFKQSLSISKEDLEFGLKKLFIQKIEPSISSQTNKYIQLAASQVSSMVEKEISGIRKLTYKFNI